MLFHALKFNFWSFLVRALQYGVPWWRYYLLGLRHGSNPNQRACLPFRLIEPKIIKGYSWLWWRILFNLIIFYLPHFWWIRSCMLRYRFHWVLAPKHSVFTFWHTCSNRLLLCRLRVGRHQILGVQLKLRDFRFSLKLWRVKVEKNILYLFDIRLIWLVRSRCLSLADVA